jgi:hypothetical protein
LAVVSDQSEAKGHRWEKEEFLTFADLPAAGRLGWGMTMRKEEAPERAPQRWVTQERLHAGEKAG